MEQKKILWALMSVALLLVVLLVVGVMLMPSSGLSLPMADGSDPGGEDQAGFDALEYIRDGEVLGIQEAEVVDGEFVAVTGEIVIGENVPSEVESSGSPVADVPSNTIDVSEMGASTPVAQTVSRPEPEPTRTVPRNDPAPTPAPAPVTESGVEYWIQVGSFTKTSQAEDTKRILAAKGVTSVIQTKDVEGTNYFRVRIGPYGNKPEAEKFLDWITNLPDYSGSYISEVAYSRTR